MIELVSTAALVALLGVAWYHDVRTRRVPNVVTVTGLAAALGLRALLGFSSLVDGLQGAGLALLIGGVLFALGGLGGGDAKLLTAVGGFTGPAGFLGSFALTAILGAIMALIQAAQQGLVPSLLTNLVAVMPTRRLRGGMDRRTLRTPGVASIPYAVPIALGTLIWWTYGDLLRTWVLP